MDAYSYTHGGQGGEKGSAVPFWATALLAITFGTPMPAFAGATLEPDALAIAQQVDFVNRFGALRNVSYGDTRQPVVVFDHDPGGRTVINTFQRWRTNAVDDDAIAARDLVVFKGGALRGTGILVTDHVDPAAARDYLIWLPSLRKVRRILEPDAADRWGNSNFSYGDIYLRRPQDERHELLGRERFTGCLGSASPELARADRRLRDLPAADCGVDGREVYRLRSRPLRSDLGYDERIVLVDVKTFADYRSTYFVDGQVSKVIDKSWHSLGLDDVRAQYWTYWYARSEHSGQAGMAFVPENAVSWNDDIEPRFWSEATLRRMNR